MNACQAGPDSTLRPRWDKGTVALGRKATSYGHSEVVQSHVWDRCRSQTSQSAGCVHPQSRLVREVQVSPHLDLAPSPSSVRPRVPATRLWNMWLHRPQDSLLQHPRSCLMSGCICAVSRPGSQWSTATPAPRWLTLGSGAGTGSGLAHSVACTLKPRARESSSFLFWLGQEQKQHWLAGAQGTLGGAACSAGEQSPRAGG